MLRALIALSLAAWALPSSVTAAPSRGPCGKIGTEGCCAGETLYWCEGRRLRTLDCQRRPRCGWHDRGRYDCNTAGNADPSGKHAKYCPKEAKLPATAGTTTCGKITPRGCCDGSKLRYCDQGQLRMIDCARNPSCGFRGVGQIYDCGTDSKADPRNRHPIQCPPAPSAPAKASRAHFVGTAPAEQSSAGPTPPAPKEKPSARKSSGCALGAGAGPWSAVALLLALLWAQRPRGRGGRRGHE